MKIFIPILLLFAGAAALRAQDYSVTPIDGPAVKADTVRNKPGFLPLPFDPTAANQPIVNPLEIPRFETRYQRAARLGTLAKTRIREMYDRDLDNLRLQVYAPFLRLAPMGFVRLQGSNAMILGREPGKYPFDNPYSPVNFPQTVRSEYDIATGTYKMVPIPWEEYQLNQNFRFNPANFNNAPIPQVKLTPGDQIMPH